MTRDELLRRAKQRYAGAAQGSGRFLDRIGALPKSPPPHAHRVRHWAYSLTQVHDSVGLAALDVPWWTYRAIDVVEAWLLARPRPARVFEYGSGASTLWLARRVAEVHSVEHDAGFAALVADLVAGWPGAHVDVITPEASAHPVVSSAKEGFAGLDFAAYVAAIDRVEGEFDVIVIDGRARESCLARAMPRLSADGIIVFDNSRRRRYRMAIAAAGLSEQVLRGLTPTLPYPDQTSILTSDYLS